MSVIQNEERELLLSRFAFTIHPELSTSMLDANCTRKRAGNTNKQH